MSIVEKIVESIKNDPVKRCEVYKHKGCNHVDSFWCLMDDCEELIEYRHELERWKKIKKICNATDRKKI